MHDVINTRCGAAVQVAVSAVGPTHDASPSSAAAGILLAAAVVYCFGIVLDKTTIVALLVLGMVIAAVGAEFSPFRR